MKKIVANTKITATKGHFEIICKDGRGFTDYVSKNLNDVILSYADFIKANPAFVGEITEIKWVED